MKALRSFTVRPSLPPELSALEELAFNLRWSWDDQTRDLFRWVDPHLWDASVHDPVRMLGLVDRQRLEALAHDAGFKRFLGDVRDELQRYLDGERWFQSRGDSPLDLVAYFSPEFGIAEAVPQYSGGLGVLAGDHLKTSSDLGVPLVGVGLLYRHGYFRQSLDADGWQQERYPLLDPHVMALTLCDGVRISVDIAGVPLVAQVWKADVGRVPLYFLDADVDDNPDDIRAVTDRLYGGDVEHRLRQEILLGIGGVQALQAVGVGAQVFHTNEGHAGFLGLERIRQLVTDQGLSYPEAIEAVRAGCIFTTHTPVPAGIDRFPRELMDKYFSAWCAEVGVGVDDLMTLGHRPSEPPDERFNMAVMGLRLAGQSNGVAQLHGEVSREMFADLWSDLPTDEIPITSITNGVHAHTWVSPEMADVFTRHVLPDWDEAGPAAWEQIFEMPDDELWRAREQGRERLVTFVRRRLKEGARARGLAGSDVAWADEVLDPRVLTIGFARRFATYKRATLLLSQPDRLKALLLSPDRPIQLVFAGKAHPADEAGKEMIRQIVAFSSDAEVRHRVVFVDDYDIAVARALYQGADVWLNNPRRPQEACGTSGMKSALNGGLNLSILDGWWHEMFDGDNGWAISSAEDVDDIERRDELEASALFDLLERQVVPLFYETYGGPVPRRWLKRVRKSLTSLGPRVTASRMVADYVERLYEPTAARTDTLAADGLARARALAAWKQRVAEAWHGVHVDRVDGDMAAVELGASRDVEAVVSLGSLSADDVDVQLVHGPVGQGDELTERTCVSMYPGGPADDGHARYVGSLECSRAGRYGLTVRIVPRHADLVDNSELGLAAWA
ncbi:MAG TPA: alpha-glucan family phosphorylase [Acidimicrobiales bacterium]|nr:alpha-glucan family phosphorylase [Acidimicrobiales bacterium]